MVSCSKDMQKYFDSLKNGCMKEFKVATEARKKNYDPQPFVETTLAATMAERVIGLISVVAPQIKNTGAEARIEELENKYGVLDIRVAMYIAEDVAKQKFCKFKDEKEAIEVGIRTGFTYVTLGVVSSPLEGFTHLDFKDRNDGQGKYMCIYYSGPIRNAGGTAAAWSVVIADYLRVKFGYKPYDPNEKEIKRCHAELEDYHEWITNLQYFPSKEESEFMMKNIPIEISGDPSEKYEVSNVNYKDLPRVNTNKLRSGFCLLHSSCLPLKAPKVWAKVSNWKEEMGMEHWGFLEEFVKLQKKMKSKGKKSSDDGKVAPDFTYIKDLVAGRPVYAHPMAKGGFRLRYGRSRVSGYSGQSVHPATMQILNGYLATGTQLKVERPGKAAAYTVCNDLDGPIVKLKSGEVIFLETEELAIKHRKEIETILFLGDFLICYGDFFDRAHPLVPAGYCPEWWILELEKSIVNMFGTFDYEKVSEIINISEANMKKLFDYPMRAKLSFNASKSLSETFNIPLHPRYIYYWDCTEKEDFKLFLEWFKLAEIKENKIVIKNSESKKVLEEIGIPHTLVNKEFVVIEGDVAKAVEYQLCLDDKSKLDIALVELQKEESTILDSINLISKLKLRDKGGTFVGARMGRPEKAKMREMTGGPHGLFPTGLEGGRLKSFQSCLDAGKVTADFGIYYCESCKEESLFPNCDCGKKAKKMNFSKSQGYTEEDLPDATSFKNKTIEIKPLFDKCLKHLKTNIYPDLIKGPKGTFNPQHVTEHLMKAILRAKHGIKVNKDGTTRYDASELPITHFKPRELFVSVEKLKELGYEKDIHNKELVNDNQVLEIKPQDVILPCSHVSPNEKADEILFRTTKFIDEMLTKMYGLKPFYNLKTKADLVGQFIVGLAPHTSAGILGRIIGFSKTQAFFAHPLYHAAMRRDVDGDESCMFLLMDCFLNFSNKFLPSSRGSTMDAPLVLTYILNPTEVDDMAFNVDIVFKYPLELYEGAQKHIMPWDVKIKQVGQFLNTPLQYEGYGYTHETTNLNKGVLCSAYKLLPSMREKLEGQMDLAVKIRAVDQSDVARLVIEKHFIRDIKGNLRKFSSQKFRCVECNEKFRRPPLIGKCTACGGKIIFTISEGSVVKYLEPSISLAEKYQPGKYLIQTLELTKRRIEDMFGRDAERQEGLGKWFDG